MPQETKKRHFPHRTQRMLENRIKPCLIAMANHIARQRRAKKKHGVTRLFAD
jgi:hypothetical protein